MKKQTKRVIWVFFIILVMFGSSLAFIVIGVVPETPRNQISAPKEFVFSGRINQTLRDAYLSIGYTIMEFHYYENCCEDIQLYMDTLPRELPTLHNQAGDYQLLIEKIQDGTGPSITLESKLGREEKNVTSITDVFEPLCNVLVRPPSDCGLLQMNITAS